MSSLINISSDKVKFKSGMLKTLRWFFLVNIAVIISLAVCTAGIGLALAPVVLMLGGTFPFISLFFSKWLAKRAHHITLIDSGATDVRLKELYEIVDKLRQKAGMNTMPEVGVYESPEVNAFATGRNKDNAIVAFSSGLINKMSMDEIAAVAAHEIAHIANGDMITLSIVQSVVNALTLLITLPLMLIHILGYFDDHFDAFADFLMWVVRIVVSGVLLFIGNMVVNLFSRQREFEADKLAAELLNKDYMIQALEVLKDDTDNLTNDKALVAYSAMKISGTMSMLGDVFSTHPSLERRIQALQDDKIKSGNAVIEETINVTVNQSSISGVAQDNNVDFVKKEITVDKELLVKILNSVNSDGYYVGSMIPPNKLQNAIQTYPIDLNEDVLALVDTTVMGSAKTGLAIGLKGIYFRNDWTTKTSKNFLSWQELVESKSPIGDGSMGCIFLVIGCELSMSGSSMKKIVLINLLNQIINQIKFNETNSVSNVVGQDNNNIQVIEDNDMYQNTLLQLLAIFVVADGVVDDKQVELATEIVSHDELISNVDDSLLKLAEHIERLLKLSVGSATIFKLKIMPIMNALAGLSTLEKDQVKIILDGISDNIVSGSNADNMLQMAYKKLVA